jgi:AraC-like DNA-binding protein
MGNLPSIERIDRKPGQSFSLRRIIRNHRPDQRGRGVWHYHPEYELTLTLKSKGNRFVGYSISPYQCYDLALVGPNIPHCWITDEPTEQIVLNFKHDDLVTPFQNFPEWTLIQRMISNSHLGIKFTEETAKSTENLFLNIEHAQGFDRLLLMFELMNELAHSPDQEHITFYDYQIKDQLSASNRIEFVYSYILENYASESLCIDELCQKLNLTKSSLARFIKRITRKTFTELVIEARLNSSCQLLRETDRTIAEICFKSGFNNLSNFNRAFKRKMDMTPKDYRKIYRQQQ